MHVSSFFVLFSAFFRLVFLRTLRLAADSHGEITDDGDGDLRLTNFRCCNGATVRNLHFEKMEFAGLRQYVEKHNGRVRRRILLLGVYMQQDLELTPNVQLFFDSPLCTRITMRFFEEAADFMDVILPAIKVGEDVHDLGVASDDGYVDEAQTPPDDNESDAALLSAWEWLELGMHQ